MLLKTIEVLKLNKLHLNQEGPISVNNVLREYDEMKEEIKNANNAVEYYNENNTI